MPSLLARDLAAMLDLVRRMNEAPDALAVSCVSGVRLLIGGKVATFSDFDLRTSVAAETTDPADVMTTAGREAFERYLHQHPLITHYARTGDGRAHMSSDFLSQSALHRLPLYNEYVKPYFNTNYQIAIAVNAQPSRVIGLSLARERRDFSERDREMLNILRPHIAFAVRHAESMKALAVNQAFGRGDDRPNEVIVANARGRIQTASPRAHEWVRRYFGRPRSPNRLPDAICLWLEEQLRARDRVEEAPSTRPLVAQDDRTRLVVRYTMRGDSVLVLLEQQQTVVVERLIQLGLTPREAEVLMWVVEGKATAAVAVITGSAARTVEKHLERIYRKLDVDNRTAAAAVVHDLLRRDDRWLAPTVAE